MKFTVSEDTEIVVNGNKMLLEKGDNIIIEYVKGYDYNTIKMETDIDTSNFVNKNLETMLERNPNLKINDVLKAFIAAHPSYLTSGPMAEKLSTDEIKKKLYYSIKIAINKKKFSPTT